jgi:hypothetical protein
MSYSHPRPCLPSLLHWVANVLDFGMDLKKTIGTPYFMGPYFGSPLGGGQVPQIYMEVLAEGEFDENLVKAVVAKGQAIKLLL